MTRFESKQKPHQILFEEMRSNFWSKTKFDEGMDLLDFFYFFCFFSFPFDRRNVFENETENKTIHNWNVPLTLFSLHRYGNRMAIKNRLIIDFRWFDASHHRIRLMRSLSPGNRLLSLIRLSKHISCAIGVHSRWLFSEWPPKTLVVSFKCATERNQREFCQQISDHFAHSKYKSFENLTTVSQHFPYCPMAWLAIENPTIIIDSVDGFECGRMRFA